ncbi:MAG: hypothetical protein K8R91_05505 [Phycisphaerae bacterium]|nr:hypothetical protein [Phycisphaerae bacterium]
MLNYLTLNEAAEVLPGWRNHTTIWRWCEKGIRVRRTGRRTRLKHIHLARQLFTTTEWIEDFLAEMAGEVVPDQPDQLAYQPTLPLHRRRALADADAILKEAGI